MLLMQTAHCFEANPCGVAHADKKEYVLCEIEIVLNLNYIRGRWRKEEKIIRFLDFCLIAKNSTMENLAGWGTVN